MQVIAYRENGDTSNIERVFLYKDSGATAGTEGDPITGLAFNTASLNISTIAHNEAVANIDTSAATSSIETVTTLGTYSTPTAGFVRFREVDATNTPGLYEIQWENARYAVSSGLWLDICISGAADLAPFLGRIYTNPIASNVSQYAGGAIPAPAVTGVPDVNTTHVGDTAQTALDINDILTDTAVIGIAGAGLTNLGASGNDWNTVVPDAAGVAPTAAEIETEVWDALQSAHVITDSMGAIATELAAVKAETVLIVADTGELQADDVPTLIANLDAVVDTVKAETVLILADTGTTLQAELDAIQAAVITNAVGVDIAADIATAQADLDIITGASGVNLLTATQTSIDTIEAGLIVTSGTADSGTTTTMVDAALTEGDTDYWNYNRIHFTSGTIAGQVRAITGFVPGTDTVTFSPATTQAVGTNTYEILPDTIQTVTVPTAVEVADQVWDEAMSGHTTAGTSGDALGVDVPAILVDTATTIPGTITTLQADTDDIQTRLPTTAELAYIVANAALGVPVTITTSGGSTTACVFNLVDGSAGDATDDHYNGRILVFDGGTLAGQATDITDYTGSSTTATITAITEAPTSSHTARLI